MNTVRGVLAAVAVSLMLGGCVFGEQQIIEGYIDNAYDNSAVAHAVAGARAEIDGRPVIELTFTDFELLRPPDLSLEVGETRTVGSGDLNVDEGTELLVYLNSAPTVGIAIAYAMDTGTDLPVPGFDKPTFGDVSQEAALDCLADVYGTTGAHRREEALREDDKLSPEDRHWSCMEAGEG